jgi:spermidine synthase
MNKYILEITVFIVGAVVMILEMVGSRVLAPYLGTSIIVWTSLIGIILASLSLGYYFGGRLADKNPNYLTFCRTIFFSSLPILFIAIFKTHVLSLIGTIFPDLRTSAVVSTIILFSLPSILLGVVSPYAVKLRMESLKKSGTTVGNLYAISTAGSIFGTFLTGFYLIAYFGDNGILLLLFGILIITATMVYFKKPYILLIIILLIIILKAVKPTEVISSSSLMGLIDIDTQYNKVLIFQDRNFDGKLIRRMNINSELSSAMFLDSNELVFDYTKFYNLFLHFQPNAKSFLLIGGAGYSYPKYFLEKYIGKKLDVVEIDPILTSLARQYFNLQDNKDLRIYHQDGRIFLNKSVNKYDVILIDAFRSSVIPYQLTTKEATEQIYHHLNDKGVVLINIISSINGETGKFLRAEYATYQSVFPQTYLFPVTNSHNGSDVQNIILVAFKSNDKPSFNSNNLELINYINHLWKGSVQTDLPILTDDYSPVDNYTMKLFNQHGI